METTKRRRRRRTEKPQVENYYKILGTRANASQETIKKKYIEMVKAYPPETHPEEFQQIRRAYETLRDPIKRKEYDLMRKYGDSVDKLMEEALAAVEWQNYDKAEDILKRVLKIEPNSIPAYLALAQIAAVREDMAAFEEHFARAFEIADEPEKIFVISIKVRLLCVFDKAEQALEVLDQAKGQLKDPGNTLAFAYMFVYRYLGQEEKGWHIMQSLIPSPEEQKPEHIDLFIDWIRAMIDLEKWNEWSKIKSRVRTFLKSLTDEEDRFMAVTALMQEYEDYFAGVCFREAELFVDLASFIDPKNPEILKARRLVQEKARLEKEINRLQQDFDMFPLVSMQAAEWYYGEFLSPEEVDEIWNKIPVQFINELKSMNEEYAAGINRLRKKYPLVYRSYQEQWDQLYQEKIAGLNREARRRLR